MCVFIEQDLESEIEFGQMTSREGIASKSKRMKYRDTLHIQRNTHYAKGNTGLWDDE